MLLFTDKILSFKLVLLQASFLVNLMTKQLYSAFLEIFDAQIFIFIVLTRMNTREKVIDTKHCSASKVI